eukprot:GGOE01014114.1.p1 GENE.GGOE01014114.1~~GGOE01014114.1.p1  ORF type:complete len:300 (-),score=94.71 GGOE01014114.1:626-1456(-)
MSAKATEAATEEAEMQALRAVIKQQAAEIDRLQSTLPCRVAQRPVFAPKLQAITRAMEDTTELSQLLATMQRLLTMLHLQPRASKWLRRSAAAWADQLEQGQGMLELFTAAHALDNLLNGAIFQEDDLFIRMKSITETLACVCYGVLSPLCLFGNLAPELCERFRIDVAVHAQRCASVAAFLSALDLAEALYRCRLLLAQRRRLRLNQLAAAKLEMRRLNKVLEAALLKLLKQGITFVQALQAANVPLYGRRTEAMLVITLTLLDVYHWCIDIAKD